MSTNGDPLSVPRLLVLTDRTQTAGRPLVEVVAAALDGGAPAIVLREKDLGRDDRARLADLLRPLVVAAGAHLLVASDPRLAADGVHLAAADPFPRAHHGMVGRSAHTADELRAAANEGCAYATCSPIFASGSKPGYGPALGVGALADAPLPVLALGGVTARNAAMCVGAGAHGVAVVGAAMRAADPAAVVEALLDAVTAADVAR